MTLALNPYLPEWEYIPDGEPYVFGDRVYVYGSHDQFGAAIFCSDDYVCWSAPVDDLGDWRCEGVIFRRTQDPTNRSGRQLLFAPDVAQGPDGRFYLYYGLSFTGILGVAVCDEPAGRYEFLGHIQHPDGTPYGRHRGDGFGFDPAVLVDEGRVWLYSGFYIHVPRAMTGGVACRFDGAYVMELEPDMHTIRGKEHLLLPKDVKKSSDPVALGFAGHEFFEASSIRRMGDTYVFVYSSRVNHELCYATSDRPDGGFRFGGVLVSLGDVGLPGHPDEASATNYLGNTHGGILTLGMADGANEVDKNAVARHYIFYHRQTNRNSYARQACAERLHLGPNGEFLQAEVTSCGLNDADLPGQGTYPARIACNLWSATGTGRVDDRLPRLRLAGHPYFRQEGEAPDVVQYIANLRDGAVAGFKYLDLSATRSVSVCVRGSFEGVVEVVDQAHPTEDVPDATTLATVRVGNAGREWTSFLAPLSGGREHSALYLRFRGKGRADLLSVTLTR